MRIKNPITGGSNGCPALKNEKKKVIKNPIKIIPNSFRYLKYRLTTFINKKTYKANPKIPEYNKTVTNGLCGQSTRF